MRFSLPVFLSALLMSICTQAAEPVPLSDFARHGAFSEAKISPQGTHLAVSAIIDGMSLLNFVDLATMENKALRLSDQSEIVDFWWVSDNRVVYAIGHRYGGSERPQATGELFAVNVDGKGQEVLFGYRASDSRSGSTGTHIAKKQSENASGWMLDDLRDDDKNAILMVRRWNWNPVHSSGGERLHIEVRKIDVRTGKNRTVAVSPLVDSLFLTDHEGVARFAFGEDSSLMNKVYYREGDNKSWSLVLDEAVGGVSAVPVAFNRAGDGVYFFCGGSDGVGGVCLWDVAKQSFKTLWSGKDSGAFELARTFDGKDVYAIRSMPGRTAVTLLDASAFEGKLLVEMMKVFPGEDVTFTSNSRDGKKIVVHVQSDLNPGSYYLYDVDSKKLSLLLSREPWIKSDSMASMQPISLKSRDGLALHGYLTKPLGKEDAKNLPTVVYVHGGPYSVRDNWGYSSTVQALASRGYAVLQVNFRGSGGYGGEFVNAGHGEWGGKMQDDVTDATRWAIAQGVADPKRICIYGTSYGGYAALQGAAREPDLYQCAIGDSGVYDLKLMKSRGDIPQSFSGERYLDIVLGDDETLLEKRSPINQIDRIKAKVMLVVGGKDERVPPLQGQNMRNAMIKRGKEVEWIYQPNEGHGFYIEKNVTDMYEKVIGFLDRSIGIAAKPVAATE